MKSSMQPRSTSFLACLVEAVVVKFRGMGLPQPAIKGPYVPSPSVAVGAAPTPNPDVEIESWNTDLADTRFFIVKWAPKRSLGP